MPFMGNTSGVEITDHTNQPKEEKKNTKKIIHFNGKDWIKCDQCGTMTSEIPCQKCGGPPVKDLDTLWGTENINNDTHPKKPSEYDPGAYFQDGGVSCKLDSTRFRVW